MKPPAEAGVAAPSLGRGELELQEIRGPSAFGGDWRRFLHLLWLNAVTDFRLRYAHTWLGYLWTLLRPLVYFGVIYGIIRFVIRYGGGIDNFPQMLLLNIMLFQFFSDGTSRSVKSVAQREAVVRKMQFPRIVIPLSVVLSATLTTAVNTFVVFGVLSALGDDPRWTWLLLPVVLFVLLIFTVGVALLLSALYPRFRDVDPAWSLIARLLFYATPILYAIEFVPEAFRPVIMANPLAPIFEQARIWVVDPNAPSLVESVGGNPAFLLIPAGIFVALVVLGLRVFEREAPRAAEEL